MFCLLIAGSLSFVRARAYDAFLLVHISFAAVVLAGVYYHLDELSERVTYHRFLWIAIDIWVFDRLLRILRVVYINMKPVVLKGTQAILNQPEGSDLLRVEVTDFFPAGRSFNPGQHYFIYEPARLRGYECHPFTLCSWTYAAPRPREHAIEQNKELGITSVRSSVDSANEDSTLDDSPMRHSFLIRPRGGFTKRLQDRFLASSPDLDDEGRARGVPVRILLEGPYQSDPTSTRSPSSLLLIIGGSGITSAISRIYDALQRSPDLHVHLVWIVRSRATVDDVCAHELSGLRGRPGFEMSVYVTSLSASLPDVEKMDFAAANYALHSGRPNVGAIIGEERGKCTAAESGGLSVFCCGPLSLASSCRDAVQDALKQNGANLEFHEEDFGF
jgi:predicted ferric reductase